jgi:hypothetical protein
MIAGFALVAIGSLISLIGLAVGATAVSIATRRWLMAQDQPPSAAIKQKIGQATAATAAGAKAWQSTTAGQSASPRRARG